MKKEYQSPRILKIVNIKLGNDLLSGSVVDSSTSVTSTGQEVVDYDFSNSEFNHNWE